MNRFLVSGLTTLALVTAIAPGQAIPVSYNPPNPATETSIRQITPSDLVSVAQQGQLKTQGIPSGARLASEYVLGRVGAKEVIQSAIAANLLPTSAVNDSSYYNAVESQLQNRLRVY